MHGLLVRVCGAVKRDGVVVSVNRAIRYPFVVLRERQVARALPHMKSREARFDLIFRKNYWGSIETVSGPGSTLHSTVNIRQHLPTLFLRFRVRRVLDAPCGDFNWMQSVVAGSDIAYVGGDIVADLVRNNQAKFAANGIDFRHMDVTRDGLPSADLMICRDCLFHFSYSDTMAFMANFLRSGIQYLLTTTHINRDGFSNRDILTGDFRRIDLTAAPYFFPAPIVSMDDFVRPQLPRELCLWDREQVSEAFKLFSEVVAPPEDDTRPVGSRT